MSPRELGANVVAAGANDVCPIAVFEEALHRVAVRDGHPPIAGFGPGRG